LSAFWSFLLALAMASRRILAAWENDFELYSLAARSRAPSAPRAAGGRRSIGRSLAFDLAVRDLLVAGRPRSG
jgi:hypothetical protein